MPLSIATALPPPDPSRRRLIGTGCRSFKSEGAGSNPAGGTIRASAAASVAGRRTAETSRHRLRGYNQLPKIIMGVKFDNGIEVVRYQAQTACRLTSSVTKIGDGSLAGIMHHAERFCTLIRGPHAGNPSGGIGVRQLAVQRVWG